MRGRWILIRNKINDWLKLYKREKKRNIPKSNRYSLHILFRVILKCLIAILCIIILFNFVREIDEERKFFYTFNAIDYLNDNYNGDFEILSPTNIDFSNSRPTPNRILFFYK